MIIDVLNLKLLLCMLLMIDACCLPALKIAWLVCIDMYSIAGNKEEWKHRSVRWRKRSWHFKLEKILDRSFVSIAFSVEVLR